ncbi:ABC transporter substrate-binding protein [Streptomyces sp. JJ36]|uniref:ABC transporter substrate-binding protein n=1 Tax=Streptomyces sp. JJ36 TaxID=2736645 RepID=UPI001F16F2A6|nr:hypothetical protein [Streptomyces sp. JJ36]MCF6524709.1 hypothetical protein [Streptomyces sp. JJ36]
MLRRLADFLSLLTTPYKIVVGLVCAALLAGLGVVVWPSGDGCGPGLERRGDAGECIGVTAEAHVFDEDLAGLIRSVAAENARVRDDWEDPDDGRARIPYVRIALMMPYTSDATSAMTEDLIRHGLAGAHTAQLRANRDSGLQYELLMANDGKDLDQWRPVVDQLAGETGGEAPLVAVLGFPNSVPDTRKAAEALSAERIPNIGPVLTSRDMTADRLFKTSASNKDFALALEEYLAEQPGSGRGFLVWDARKQDNYAQNLREVFMEHFGAEYGLRKRNGSYLGVIGEEAGIPRRFTPLAQKICLTGADTLFYAGRDRDLAALVGKLAEQPSCDHEKPLRILKVGIGRDPEYTGRTTTRQMREAKITTVGAVDVDPRWWEGGAEPPRGFQSFLEVFQSLAQRVELGRKPLDDGYTIMYHDAFTVAAQAADESFTAANEDAPEGFRMPTKDDVYNTIVNMSVLGTEDGSDCVNCVRGASGTFGYDAEPSTDKWPVCKPVPVIEYPVPEKERGNDRARGEEADEASGPRKDQRRTEAPAYYRTHEDVFGGDCL